MKLASPALLQGYMKHKDFSQARLGRYAGCSRQFIWQLLNDDDVNTCTPEIAKRIEEALDVLPGTLFVEPVSSQKRQAVTANKTKGRAAA